jgi:hypothetical protein
VNFDDREHTGWKLRSDLAGASVHKDPRNSNGWELSIPLPEVDIDADSSSPVQPGARTSEFRVLSQVYGVRRIDLTVEGMAGSEGNLVVLRQKLVQPGLKLPEGVVEGIDREHASVNLTFPDRAHEDGKSAGNLEFHFAPGNGWQTITVTVTW